MKMQKDLIHDFDWRHLFVLDACRYDVLKEVYDKYFDGKIEKVKSEASCTCNWLRKTWTGNYIDVDYVSANPYSNNLGVSIGIYGFPDWKATNHFSEIYDVWGTDWDKDKGTVWPEDMTKNVLSVDSPKKRVYHYIQPHRPLLSLDEDSQDWQMRNMVFKGDMGLKVKIRKKVGNGILSIFGGIRGRNLIKFIRGIDHTDEYGRLSRKIGTKKIIDAYKKNVEKPLGYISKIVSELDGKIVITSDHGEVFGQEGIWGHARERTDIDDLVKVPWLVINDG